MNKKLISLLCMVLLSGGLMASSGEAFIDGDVRRRPVAQSLSRLEKNDIIRSIATTDRLNDEEKAAERAVVQSVADARFVFDDKDTLLRENPLAAVAEKLHALIRLQHKRVDPAQQQMRRDSYLIFDREVAHLLLERLRRHR